MKIHLNWHAPLPLIATKPPAYECDLDVIPSTPGIYIYLLADSEKPLSVYISEKQATCKVGSRGTLIILN